MMKLVGFLILTAFAYAWFSTSAQNKKQTELLEKEVQLLRQETEGLKAKKSEKLDAQPKSPEKHVASPAEIARLKDLQNQFNAETTKLIALQKRKDQLTAAASDPAQANSTHEVQEEIREKNEQIQSLELQLTNTQSDERMVDHSAEQAKSIENFNKARATTDLNNRIRAQQQLIKTTEDSIRAKRIKATGDSMSQANVLQTDLAQQKIDLQNLQVGRDQINVTSAAQTVQIHQQVGVVKNDIRANEQEMRGQINQLKNEIKSLQNQNAGHARTTAQLKDQMNHVDQQIASEKIVIDRLQKLLAAENAH